jgi:hypothetical protein
MKTKLAIGFVLVSCNIGFVGSSPLESLPQGKPPKEVFTGTVMGWEPRGGTFTRGFTLTIEGYTSDADALRYAKILKAQGQDALLKAIGREKKGTFSIDGELGRDLNTVRVHPIPTGKVYKIVFERWLKLFEVRYGTRSEDYPFTYIELFAEEKGIGGTLLPAAKIRFDKENNVEFENFGTYPAKLTNVRRVE